MWLQQRTSRAPFFFALAAFDEGNGARQILGLDPGAIRTVIVGDEVDLSE